MNEIKQFIDNLPQKDRGWGIVLHIAKMIGISKGSLTRAKFLELMNYQLETINCQIEEVVISSGLPDESEIWNRPNEPMYRFVKVD